jgi:parvulin-like peptidyl-prolyl isomerase
VSDSGLFSRDEPLAGLGFAPAVASTAFTMEEGKVSGQLRTNQGIAFIALAEIKPPAIPTLDEVKDRVREDVIKIQAVVVARARAESMSKAAQRGSFAAAAKAAGVDVKSTELITRGSPYPDVGVNSSLDDALFALSTGQTSGALQTDAAVVVARVTDRTDVTAESVAAGKSQVRDELLQQRRQEFFSAYMTKAKQKMRISFNEVALRSVFGNQ